MHSTRSRTSLTLLCLALAWPAWVQPLAPGAQSRAPGIGPGVAKAEILAK